MSLLLHRKEIETGAMRKPLDRVAAIVVLPTSSIHHFQPYLPNFLWELSAPTVYDGCDINQPTALLWTCINHPSNPFFQIGIEIQRWAGKRIKSLSDPLERLTLYRHEHMTTTPGTSRTRRSTRNEPLQRLPARNRRRDWRADRRGVLVYKTAPPSLGRSVRRKGTSPEGPQLRGTVRPMR